MHETCVKGIDNPLKIDVKGLHIHKLIFRSDTLSRITKEEGGYNISSNRSGCKVIVYDSLNDGTLKKLAEKYFSFIPFPPPTCYVGNKKGEFSTTREQMKIVQAVRAIEEWGDFSLYYKVLSFDMFACIGGTWVHEESESNLFTPEMKVDFAKLSKGDKVYITNVKCKGPANEEIIGVKITIED